MSEHQSEYTGTLYMDWKNPLKPRLLLRTAEGGIYELCQDKKLTIFEPGNDNHIYASGPFTLQYLEVEGKLQIAKSENYPARNFVVLMPQTSIPRFIFDDLIIGKEFPAQAMVNTYNPLLD